MNRLITLCLVFLAGTMQAQTYVGLKGSALNTWMLNKHIADAGDEVDYKGSFAGGVALEGVFMFGGTSGLGLELGLNTLKQQTQGEVFDIAYINEWKAKYTNVAVLYKYMSEGGLYFEAGPQFGFRNEEFVETLDLNGSDEEVFTYKDELINKTAIYGVVGIGSMINLTEEIKLSLGLRFGYGLNDLTKELSQSEYEDLDSDYSFLVDFAHTEGITSDDPKFSYTATHPAFASFNLGLFYSFGN